MNFLSLSGYLCGPPQQSQFLTFLFWENELATTHLDSWKGNLLSARTRAVGIFSFLLTETEILVRRRSALDFLLAFEGQLTFDLQININIKQNIKNKIRISGFLEFPFIMWFVIDFTAFWNNPTKNCPAFYLCQNGHRVKSWWWCKIMIIKEQLKNLWKGLKLNVTVNFYFCICIF